MAYSLDDGVTSLDFKIIVNIWMKGWHLIFLGEKVKIEIDFNKWLGSISLAVGNVFSIFGDEND